MSSSTLPGSWPLVVLTDEQHEVLRLRVVHGLSAEQAALVLGSTPAEVRLVQHQALEALRAVITGSWPLPP
ncbi:sigma-70-like protein [Lentzea atacamensis]|uniref:Sigma-70-like protein n=1 Tax=Lentzea atacamensis TaxID=531938 RepID=A0A316HWY3_9PSEU|nr:sigma factor-like helix-turn-helix DNA-binding protein [Lentzea atacamensis]PWK84915.1 sigma-70-like protein [Lentzea atacamensis]RAS65927.1 sigma-70-like protein [Lentzea atacamensis]